jgi:hypothetical protein
MAPVFLGLLLWQRPLGFTMNDGLAVRRIWAKLIRWAFLRWSRQQERLVDGVAQAQSGLNISAQIRHNDLLIDDAAGSHQRAISRQRNIHNTVGEAERWRVLIKDERSVRGVANRHNNNLAGLELGSSCMTAPTDFGRGTTGQDRFCPSSRLRSREDSPAMIWWHRIYVGRRHRPHLMILMPSPGLCESRARVKRKGPPFRKGAL